MSADEKRKLKRELNSLMMGDISSFMESLSPDFFTILRTEYEPFFQQSCLLKRKKIQNKTHMHARAKLNSYTLICSVSVDY